MMNITFLWNFYPLVGIVACGLLYAVYRLTLRMETKARWAQAYIVTAVIIATVLTFVLPARVVERPLALSPAEALSVVEQSTFVEGRQMKSLPLPPPKEEGVQKRQSSPSLLGLGERFFRAVYAVGVALMLLYFLTQLLWFARERRRQPKASAGEEADIYHTNYSQPFSFGRSIFLPAALTGDVRHYALTHELCHLRRHHFRRLCFMELLLAVNWFNPFVWLLFNELKLQQELEVDADVLAQGIDRQQYQLSLLQMTVEHSRWLLVQSAFGTKPIKNRIVFMNRKLETRSLRRRLAASAAATVLVLIAIITMSFQMNEQVEVKKAKHHAIYGAWQMDFTRPANSQSEMYPPFKQYAFYSDDVFFTPHFSYRSGKNMYFGYSGEGLSMKGDTLVGGRGFPIIYRFVNENTFQSDWTKEDGDLSLANGKVNTDQWSRLTPNPEIISLFRAAYNAGEAHEKPLDGTWQGVEKDGYSIWLMFNGDVMLLFSYHQNDPQVYRFGGDGTFCEVTYHDNGTVSFGGELSKKGKAHYQLTDDGRLTISYSGKGQDVLQRKPLPEKIHRILAATLIDKE